MVQITTRLERARGIGRGLGRRLATGYDKIRRRLSARRRG